MGKGGADRAEKGKKDAQKKASVSAQEGGGIAICLAASRLGGGIALARVERGYPQRALIFLSLLFSISLLFSFSLQGISLLF